MKSIIAGSMLPLDPDLRGPNLPTTRTEKFYNPALRIGTHLRCKQFAISS
jgi:hypothetical protein